MHSQEFTIGIDEVGRGPLAGPVGVGVVCVPADFDWAQLPGVTDSKVLSATRRAEILQAGEELRHADQLRFAVSLVSARVIDRVGIVPATTLAMERALRRLQQGQQSTTVNRRILPTSCAVKLDGGLRAPAVYAQQETIIKGDATEPVIGFASIVAKVARDRYMTRLAKQTQYAAYDFAAHKGYGTQAHRAAIAQYGLSDQHRASYCRNIKSIVQ